MVPAAHQKTFVAAAGEAFNLAKQAGTKLTNSIAEAGSKLIPRKDPEPPRQEWDQQEWGRPRDPEPFDFGPSSRRQRPYGLAQRDPMSNIFGSVLQGLGKQLNPLLHSLSLSWCSNNCAEVESCERYARIHQRKGQLKTWKTRQRVTNSRSEASTVKNAMVSLKLISRAKANACLQSNGAKICSEDQSKDSRPAEL